MVACTRWCREVCPEIAERDCLIVADSWSAQAGQIKAARAELVIASVPYQLEAVAQILKSGIPFLALAPHTLADIYRDIAMIAGIVGLGARGEELIAEMQREIAAVRQRAEAAHSRPRVFCEEWGKPIIASQAWVKELVEAAGGEFLGEPGAKPAAEDVARENPDVIIAAWCGAGDRVPLEKIVRDRGWNETAAAQSSRVFCIRDELLNTPGPALIQGLHALAAAIRPEIFPAAPGLRRISPQATSAGELSPRPVIK